MKGKLIVLYGVNNIGKTTQAELLVDALIEAGFPSEYMKYPRYDIEPSGPYINSVLRKGQKATAEELQLWYTINRYQTQGELKKKLDDGRNVIAEDYTGTGIAWGITFGAEKKWLESINAHLIKEDLSILMTGARYLTGVEHNHKNETDVSAMERSIQIHEKLGREYGWKAVRADQKIEEVHDDIMEIVLDFFSNGSIK